MPVVTNVSRRVIHAGDVMLIPGTPVEVPPDMMENATFKAYMEMGDIKQGEVEVKPEVEQDKPPELESTSATRPVAVPGKAGAQKT